MSLPQSDTAGSREPLDSNPALPINWMIVGQLHNLSGLLLLSIQWELCLLQVMNLKWESTFKMLCLPGPGILRWRLFMVVLLLLFTLDLCTALHSLQSCFVDIITLDPEGWN